MADILVIAAHPRMEHSRVTARLMRRAALSGPQVQVRDLYALYPEHFIDTAAEQAAVASARLLVWLHPIHWYHMPALMKLWLDEVFSFGWAYGPGGQALRGKHLWLVASTGGPAESYRADGYNRHAFDDFLPPYTQTAALTGLHWLPPLLLHGAHRANAAALQAHEDAFAARLLACMATADGQAAAADGAPDEPAGVPADARPPR